MIEGEYILLLKCVAYDIQWELLLEQINHECPQVNSFSVNHKFTYVMSA